MWKQLLLLSGLCLATAAHAIQSAPTTTPKPAAQEAPPVPSFKDPLDQTVRWMRAQQDRASGAYKDCETTALCLMALATSPRAYRAQDGPFVADALKYLASQQSEDGFFGNPKADLSRRRSLTSLSIQALTLHMSSERVVALERALQWLETNPNAEEALEETYPQLTPELRSPGEATREGLRLVSARLESGAWEGTRDSLTETAILATRLGRIDRYLAQSRKAAQASASPKSPDTLPKFTPANRTAALAAITQGVDFLMTQAMETGKWGAGGRADAGITAMVLAAAQSLPEPRTPAIQDQIDAGLVWLRSLQKKDGSIHSGQLANYVTSVAVQALVKAGVESDGPIIAKAQRFLVGLQADEGEGYSEGDLYYGGIGYGGDERPDLSNLQMALEALSASGLSREDPTFTKALRFLERCQNRSESNDVKLQQDGGVIESGNDGGSGYSPGNSKAGYVQLEDGTKVPRSYGSMTYALLKCYLFAGLEKTDPRVQAAWQWCSDNYTLDLNPGMQYTTDPTAAYQGLFYYFHGLARALQLYGEDTIVDSQGQQHAWRNELIGRLIAMQSRADGSWINQNASRWYEGNPVLATSYALMTLEAALPAE